MKRQGNLLQLIADPDNLRLAFYKAKKGKSFKRDVLRFQNNLQTNLKEIRASLLTGSFVPSEYNKFIVFEPKRREICTVKFKDRVLHHAIMNVCEERFEKYQIDTSYACRKGRGVDSAILKAQTYCRKYKWFLKLDIHKYFDSIDHFILIELLDRLFKDEQLLEIFWKIIESYQTTADRGIPIGNLTSQYFANMYLARMDHYLKENLKVPGHVRYMDDFIIFSNDKSFLKKTLQEITNYLHKELKLELNEPQLNSVICGVPFLGYRVFPNLIRLSLKAKRRFRKKLKKAEYNMSNGIWTQQEYVSHVNPLLAFIDRADSEGFLGSVIPE